MSTGALFACEADNLELLLAGLGDRRLDYRPDPGDVVMVPAPLAPTPLGVELLASLQPMLIGAWHCAVQRKGRQAAQIAVCGVCSHWAYQTTTRTKTSCTACGAKGPRRTLDIPWAHANRHGRPPAKDWTL